MRRQNEYSMTKQLNTMNNMRKTLAIVAALLLTATAFAQDGKSVYEKYSNSENVSAVYISPSMFKMMGRLPEMSIGEGDVDLTPIIKSLTGFYLVNSENASINASMKADVDKFVKAKKYEHMMEVKDGGESVNIYVMSKGDIINSFVMLAYESDECTFISFDCQIPREQLEKLIAQAIKS